MVCRNKGKAEEARVDIVSESGNTVSVVRLDRTYTKWGEKKVTNPRSCEREADTYLVILGGVHPYRGHVRDQQSLGVCRGLQEAASILECAGMLRRLLKSSTNLFL